MAPKNGRRGGMEQPGPGERPANFSVQVPPELEGGTYANFLGVWHTGHEFTLDFAVTQPPVVPDDENEPVTISSRVVARVKIPPTLVFDILRALNENMTTYESTFGEIQRPNVRQEDDPQ